MKQHEAVIATLERLGGVATLGELYREVFKIEDCQWRTRTPFASIRRIVQQSSAIFKVKPGLWALASQRERLERLGIVADDEAGQHSGEAKAFNHAYYQGLLVEIGNERQFGTFVPSQDRTRQYSSRQLGDVCTQRQIPAFSYEPIVKRSSTIDVIWFNSRGLLNSLFEIEHTTDIKNSLLKFTDLQDFHTRMYIVADAHRRAEFDRVMAYAGFDALASQQRVRFLDYGSVEKMYASIFLAKEAAVRF